MAKTDWVNTELLLLLLLSTLLTAYNRCIDFNPGFNSLQLRLWTQLPSEANRGTRGLVGPLHYTTGRSQLGHSSLLTSP